MEGHWRKYGLPAYAQFDNDTRFQGPHQHPDIVGSVIRLCLNLGVSPVFAPPREPGFQASIESLNGRWQDKVWSRSEHADLQDLQTKSDAYVSASHSRHDKRIKDAPPRRPFPDNWVQISRPRLEGRLVFVRRADERGSVFLLGRTFRVDPSRPHRLVRADVLYDEDRIEFRALRRADPKEQPLVCQIPYVSPCKE
jgi:hypothetical protein